MRLEPAVTRSRVKHSTTEPLRSQGVVGRLEFKDVVIKAEVEGGVKCKGD